MFYMICVICFELLLVSDLFAFTVRFVAQGLTRHEHIILVPQSSESREH